ncbi:hypothetical protein GTC3P0254_18400 [Burkholderia pseudomallei]|nr:hypothetical protein GTC019_21430 [Burkholderia pseudomallei]BEH37012.1 hypothetical protein GTC254T_21070 [Burkholderia pseudomallei]BEH54930.1 hypothetical protein BpKM376_21090 [Burkholderia pseudomallei]BEH67076.1 hypothetical protein BpKM391_21510 [Burkholderia pseudomallei]GEA54863.1 hypothetical protein GTC3P0254_18400 [Burkholderia pseudomallei]
MIASDSPDDQESGSFEAYFRDSAFAIESPIAWALSQRLETLDALRGLISGSQAVARLRLLVFLELAGQPQGRLQRDDLTQLFHVLKSDALDVVLKRLRELGLLVWDATAQTTISRHLLNRCMRSSHRSHARQLRMTRWRRCLRRSLERKRWASRMPAKSSIYMPSSRVYMTSLQMRSRAAQRRACAMLAPALKER